RGFKFGRRSLGQILLRIRKLAGLKFPVAEKEERERARLIRIVSLSVAPQLPPRAGITGFCGEMSKRERHVRRFERVRCASCAMRCGALCPAMKVARRMGS